ncbi:MAG TPA: GIY-YIG nuclease family protein [Edaphocola sp.]|nr:GIY-YIG nuclease family protein [Edaphocola sp.]
MREQIRVQIEELPRAAGVYYFYNEEDILLYVGKSNCIAKRVRQHFCGKDRKSLKIQTQTHRIQYELTGSELIALLYESELIKLHKPLYNRAQRRSIMQYGLYLEWTGPYKALRIARIRSDEEEITSFSTLNEAKEFLNRGTAQHILCQKINGLQKVSRSCFQYQIKECKGACLGLEEPESYNARVEKLLAHYVMEKFTRIFVLPGRQNEELGLVYIKNGVYKGFGYCPIQTAPQDYTQYIEPRKDNKDVRRILMRFLVKGDAQVLQE